MPLLRYNIRRFFSRVVLAAMLLLCVSASVQAQNYEVIYYFGYTDGYLPIGRLALDNAGNLFGTTALGGADDVGTVFKLEFEHRRWVLDQLYNFTGAYLGGCGGHRDGGCPSGGVVRDASGALYGTTSYGGAFGGGTVFRLSPSPKPPISGSTPWNESILYSFSGSDGAHPALGNLVLDPHGRLYGTTMSGGLNNCSGTCGTVFQLVPNGGTWSLRTIHYFAGPPNDGGVPYAGVTAGRLGQLYGTTAAGGTYGCGTVFRLTPSNSGTGWTETVLYNFTGGTDGCAPWAGVAVDNLGNLYGATTRSGANSGGTIFELSPSDGGWTYSLVFAMTGFGGPNANLTLDKAGNLYGTTSADGAYGNGNVFEISPSNGLWTYTSLYDFTCQLDGCAPEGGVAIDAAGNLYGTTSGGGYYLNDCYGTCGVAWQITP